MRRAGALIVGGGPAGSAAAIALARAGTPPLLIERDRAPQDALCGGFLSWATLARLRALGLDPERLGGAPIERVRLIAGRARAEARLPAGAIGLSRRALDTALLDRAAAAGAAVERGVAARTWADGVLRLADGATLAADALLLATGKHDLRGLARPGRARGAIGLRVRLEAMPALTRTLDRTIELHLFRGGYAGLLLQEDGAANLCLAAGRERLAEAGGRPERLLALLAAERPQLGERLAMARTHGPVQAIAAVPYGWRAGAGRAGLFRLGDQAAVIPSLAGEGIAIALASGVAAAEALHRAGPGAAASWQPAMARRLDRPFRLAGAVAGAAARPAGAAGLVAAMRLAPALATYVARWSRVA